MATTLRFFVNEIEHDGDIERARETIAEAGGNTIAVDEIDFGEESARFTVELLGASDPGAFWAAYEEAGGC